MVVASKTLFFQNSLMIHMGDFTEIKLFGALTTTAAMINQTARRIRI